MMNVLRRVAEARREKRARDLADVPVQYTTSPIRRVVEISPGRYHNSFRMVFGVLFSMVAHLSAAVLVVMVPVSLVQDEPNARPFQFVFSEEEEQLQEPEPNFQLAPPDKDPHENVLASLAGSIGQTFNPKRPLDQVIAPNVADALVKVPQRPPIEAVTLDPSVVRRGSVGEEIKHVEGAVDRITHEIARYLEEKDVIVVWLMDASLSLVEERKAVAENLERIFAEIDQLGLVTNDELVNAVVAFGEQTKPMVEPTSKSEKVIEAIRNVPNDESGVENVFYAINFAVERYKTRITQQRRKMMIVVWTDESGDDFTKSEPVVAKCQRFAIPVYTVGPSAMFGKEIGTRPYVHPENGQTYQLPLSRGPDTLMQEKIDLKFWFDEDPSEDALDVGNLHASLGPFALTRLAYLSGGAYFIKDEKGAQSPFELETMIRYAPEYDSVQNYLARVKSSRLRQAILQAVQITRERDLKGTPRLEFAPTGATFQQELQTAQQTAAFNIQILEQALAPFGRRGLEKEYALEKSPRWRAWYDYTFGRLLAMNVRNYEYNWACAVMKGKGAAFVDQESNRWRFVPNAEIKYGSAIKRQADEAVRLLTRCVKDHPGTPWAVLAERELRYPLGFKVIETYVAPPPPPKQNPAKAVPKKKAKPKIKPPPSKRKTTEQLRKLPRPEPVVLPKL